MTQEYERLEGIYQSIDSDDLHESVAKVLLITNSDYYVANRKAAEILHIQGKNRSLSYDVDPAQPVEELRDNYLNVAFQEQLTNLMNRYLEFIKDDKYKVNTLIVYLMVKNYYPVISNMNFTEEEFDKIDSILNSLIIRKEKLITDLADYFDECGIPLHAQRVRDVGYAVLDMRTDKSIVRNFGDLIEEIDKRPDDFYEYILELRSSYLNISVNPQFKDYLELIDLGERTFRRRKSEILSELQQFVTEEEVKTLNRLILSN